MLKEHQEPDRHFNAYYQDNSILIQLILNEFLTLRQLTDKIESLQETLSNHPKHQKEILSQLSNYIIQLIGYEGDTTFTNSKGCLTKLKNYSYQFSKNANQAVKAVTSFYRIVYRLWSHSQKNRDTIHLLEQSSHLLSPALFQQIQLSVKRFRILVDNLSRHLPKITHLFWEDENVMFFLLKKTENLLTIYGSTFIDFFFKTTVKKQQIVQLISQNYTRRGFGHLISSCTVRL